MSHFRTHCPSPIGWLRLVASDQALVAIDFDASDEAEHDAGHPVLARARIELEQYFAGERTTFDLPLAPEGSAWELAVWRALQTIPFGQTASYATIAKLLDRPQAARAVGAANGKNPVPIVIPCHRVIGSDGSLTGYVGGLDKKRWLLEHEASR